MRKLNLSQINFQFKWKNFLLLTIGAIILAININIFLAPSNLAPGGVMGIAVIINALFRWPLGLTMLLFNIPLLVLGFFYLGRYNFLIHTLIVVLVYSFGADLLTGWLPASGITDDLLLNAIYGGVLGGIGSGLIYRGNGTSGGTGILARVIQFRTGMPINQVYLFTDGVVVLIAALLFGWEIGLYSLITLFIWGVVVDYILEGPSVVRTATIITDKPQEVGQAVLIRLRLGVTSWSAQGMYTETKHTLLFCTVSRTDVDTLKSTILSVDPDAFVVIGHGHQAIGGVISHMNQGNIAQDTFPEEEGKTAESISQSLE